MLAFLALAGLLAGIGLALPAEARKMSKEEQAALDVMAVEKSKQTALMAQQAEVGQDIFATGQVYGIEQKALGVRAYETAYAGRARRGQIGAAAGAGNLAGASVLRQALSVQRATERQMTLITGEKQKMAIEYADTLREFDIKKMQLATTLLTSELKEKEAEEEYEYLKKYGWMRLVGTGLNVAGQFAPSLNFGPGTPHGSANA